MDNNSSAVQEIKYVPSENFKIQKLEPRDDNNKSDTLFLRFTVFTGLLTWIVGGGRTVWTSSALIKFNSIDPNINPLGRQITTGEISLMVGLPGIISIPSSIIFTQLADLIGRKYCLQVIGIGWLLSFIGLAFSTSIAAIITFLCVMSYLNVGTMCVFPIYLTEICENHNRAKYGCLLSACYFLGQLYTNAIGPLFNIRNYTLLVIVPLIPFLIFFNFAPESPVYLCTKGKKEECFKVLRKLRGNKSDGELEKDFSKIMQNLTSTENGRKPRMTQLFSTKGGRFGLLLSFLALFFQMTSGGPVLMPLMAPIFEQFHSIASGEVVAVSISLLKVISLFSTVLIIEKIGRRLLLIVSSIGSGISMAVLGIFLYFQYVNPSLINGIQWLPIASILVYYVMFGIGLSPIPIPMISVLSPIELQSASNSLVFTTVEILLAVFQAVYPLLAVSIGPHWCMWVFSINCFIGSLIFYWLLPETRGKSYEEVQILLTNHRYFK